MTKPAVCPVCGRDASQLEPYDIGSGPELSCPHCEWCWGAEGQSLKPITVWETCADCKREFAYPHLCREHMLCGFRHPIVQRFAES